MTGPESLYSEMTSGSAARLAAYADDVGRVMRGISDAVALVTYAADQPDWESPSARTMFNVRAWTTRATAEVAFVRLNRLELAVDAVARDYRAMDSDASDVIDHWRRQKDRAAEAGLLAFFRAIVMTQLRTVRDDFAAQVREAQDFVEAESLDPDSESGEKWLRNGLLRSLKYDLENPTDVGPLIPATLATGDDEGGIKPQGLADDGSGGLIQTGYEGGRSTLSLVDPDTGELTRTVDLGAPPGGTPPNHAGGVAVHNGIAWVTSGGDSPSVVPYDLDDLRGRSPGEEVPPAGDPVPVSAGSYSTIAGNTLYVGDYDNNQLFAYSWNPTTETWGDRRGPFPTPPEVQGLAVRGGEMVFSRSGGRQNLSSLDSYNLGDVVPYDPADDQAAIDGDLGDPLQQVELPNMSEGIVFGPNGIITTYESGGAEYSDPDGHSLEELWAARNMTVTPYSELGLAGGIDVEPATLDQARGSFEEVRDDLERAESDISSLSFPTSALGQVPVASAFGFAVGAHTFLTAHWLDQGYLSAGTTAEGLRQSVREYEDSDSLVGEVFDRLSGLFS